MTGESTNEWKGDLGTTCHAMLDRVTELRFRCLDRLVADDVSRRKDLTSLGACCSRRNIYQPRSLRSSHSWGIWFIESSVIVFSKFDTIPWNFVKYEVILRICHNRQKNCIWRSSSLISLKFRYHSSTPGDTVAGSTTTITSIIDLLLSKALRFASKRFFAMSECQRSLWIVYPLIVGLTRKVLQIHDHGIFQTRWQRSCRPLTPSCIDFTRSMRSR